MLTVQDFSLIDVELDNFLYLLSSLKGVSAEVTASYLSGFACVCLQWIRAIFPSSGHTGVREEGTIQGERFTGRPVG